MRSPNGFPATHLSARLFKSIDEEGRCQRAVKSRDLEQAGRAGLVLAGMGLGSAGHDGVIYGAKDGRFVHAATLAENGPPFTLRAGPVVQGAPR